MNTKQFLEEFVNLLGAEGVVVKAEDQLSDIAAFDSLARLSLIVFFKDNFSIKLNQADIAEFETVQDVIDKAGDHIKTD